MLDAVQRRPAANQRTGALTRTPPTARAVIGEPRLGISRRRQIGVVVAQAVISSPSASSRRRKSRLRRRPAAHRQIRRVAVGSTSGGPVHIDAVPSPASRR